MRKRWRVAGLVLTPVLLIAAFVLWAMPGDANLRFIPSGTLVHYESSTGARQSVYSWQGDYNHVVEEARKELQALGFKEQGSRRTPPYTAYFIKGDYFVAIESGKHSAEPFRIDDPLPSAISGGFVPKKGIVSVALGRNRKDWLGSRLYALRHYTFR